MKVFLVLVTLCCLLLLVGANYVLTTRKPPEEDVLNPGTPYETPCPDGEERDSKDICQPIYDEE